MTERAVITAVAESDLFITNYIFPTVMLLLGLTVIGLLRLGIRRWLKKKVNSKHS